VRKPSTFVCNQNSAARRRSARSSAGAGPRIHGTCERSRGTRFGWLASCTVLARTWERAPLAMCQWTSKAHV
jgi:hypothetical protein